MTGGIDGWERIRLLLAGANKERSYAMPAKYYGRDPARYIKFESEKTPVSKGEVMQKLAVVDTFHQQSPYEQLLSMWAAWMRLADHQHSLAEGHPQDTKEFMAAGEAVNTMIDDLPRYQWWAIRKSRNICTVWNFPNVSLDEALAQAEAILTPKLKAGAATKRYFPADEK
jgi:hypothetical protein